MSDVAARQAAIARAAARYTTYQTRRATPVDVDRARQAMLLSAGAELVGAVAFVALGLASIELGSLQFVVAAVALGLAGARISFVELGSFGTARATGLVAGAALSVIQLGVLLPALGHADDLRAACAVVGLGALPLALGLVAGASVPGLLAGNREDATPALLAAALASGVGVLVAVGVGNIVDVGGDPRVARLVPYAAASMAVLVVAELLGRHRSGAGFPETFAVVTAAAVGVQLLLLLDTGNANLDGGVTASAVAAGVAAAGLVVSTAFASPRPLVVPAEDAGDGPRLVGWVIAGLVALAAVVRFLALRPLWLDEAALAERSDAPLGTVLDAARHADAQPPLLDALAWASHQALGAGDLAVRLPALLAGVLVLPAVYITAAKLYDRRVGVVAAVVAAIGPGMVWLTTAARPGAVAALLATLALYTVLRAVESGRPTDWALFGISGAALIWSHQFGVLHVAVLVVGAAFLAPKERLGVGWGLATGLAVASMLALLAYRDGFGPPELLPPLEYATAGAPGAGRSVFGLVGTAVTALVGFHPAEVTSRLLALWPVGILAAFVVFCRSWSRRGMLLVALAAAPFVALLLLQALDAPRDPPFALEWVATAVPTLTIGVGRAATLWGRWSRVRLIGAAVALVLALAAVDQTVRVNPIARFDVAPAAERIGRQAGRGDLVVYAPKLLGDLVRTEVDGAAVVRVDAASEERLADAEEVFVIGGFGFAGEDEMDPVLALVEQVSAQRELVSEDRHGDTKVWRFR